MRYKIGRAVQLRSCKLNWFLIMLCGLLTASTIVFGVMAVTYARPLDCDEMVRYGDGTGYCLIKFEEY